MHFTITTNKDVALKIEKFFKSSTLTKDRNLELGSITYEKGLVSDYAIVQIKSKVGEDYIKPEDIFWLGFYSSDLNK